jgi:hypothetical protein
LLPGSQFLVKDDQVKLFRLRKAGQLVRFATPNKKHRIRRRALLQHALDNSGAGSFRQGLEFAQGFFGLLPMPAVEVTADQACPFGLPAGIDGFLMFTDDPGTSRPTNGSAGFYRETT